MLAKYLNHTRQKERFLNLIQTGKSEPVRENAYILALFIKYRQNIGRFPANIQQSHKYQCTGHFYRIVINVNDISYSKHIFTASRTRIYANRACERSVGDSHEVKVCFQGAYAKDKIAPVSELKYSE
jgi:hypothetical protein